MSEQSNNSNNVNTKLIIIGVYVITFFVFIVYILFHQHLRISDDTASWGVFGDYIGGLLNPIVSAFALYLAAKAYDAQRKDLQETQLAQEKQVKLAALTELLNSTIMKRGSNESAAKSISETVATLTSNGKKTEAEELAKIMEAEIRPEMQKLSYQIAVLEQKISDIGGL